MLKKKEISHPYIIVIQHMLFGGVPHPNGWKFH